MEILNILYNNNNIAYYLIGAILVVILIFIVISSMSTTPKDEIKEEQEKILEDPMENKIISELKDENPKEIIEIEKKEPSIIDEMVEELYRQKINEKTELEENPDLNTFLEEFEVPETIIDEVIAEEEKIEKPKIEKNLNKDEKSIDFKTEQAKSDDIENMLKRLYDLRQNENNTRKTALLNEIYDLKKQVDEKLKSNNYNYTLDYNNIDRNALADYYLFNEDIEFPKLK